VLRPLTPVRKWLICVLAAEVRLHSNGLRMGLLLSVNVATIELRDNMLPSFPTNYAVNIGICDPVISSQLAFGRQSIMKIISYFKDFYFSELAKWIFRTNKKAVLSSLIVSIVLVCPYKQMIGSYARRVVTFVTNQKAFWATILDFPCISMCKNIFICFAESSVSIFISESFPQPARGRFVDIFIKSYFRWYYPVLFRAWLTTDSVAPRNLRKTILALFVSFFHQKVNYIPKWEYGIGY
jgi:hypothetical protein